MVEKLLTERTTEQDVPPPGITDCYITEQEELSCVWDKGSVFVCSVLPAKPAKSKVAPSAMTDTSSLLNDAEWYWGEISR